MLYLGINILNFDRLYCILPWLAALSSIILACIMYIVFVIGNSACLSISTNLRFFCSSNSSPVNPFSNSDLVGYPEGENYPNTSRQNSSSSSASLPPENKHNGTSHPTSRSQTLTKYGGRKNGPNLKHPYHFNVCLLL